MCQRILILEYSATTITITHISHTIITSDVNNVMILAPSDVAAVSPADYRSEEHIGNLCREHATLIAKYMDFGTFSLNAMNLTAMNTLTDSRLPALCWNQPITLHWVLRYKSMSCQIIRKSGLIRFMMCCYKITSTQSFCKS